MAGIGAQYLFMGVILWFDVSLSQVSVEDVIILGVNATKAAAECYSLCVKYC